MSIKELEIDPIEASDLRRWLSDQNSRREPLSSGYQGAVYLYEGPSGQRIIKEALGSGLQYRIGRNRGYTPLLWAARRPVSGA